MNSKTQLLEKIENRTARVGIIGMGYVGLPLALRFLEAGYPVLGLDIDKRKTDMLMAGESYIEHISARPIADAVQKNRFEAVTDFSRAREADALILCVPTPLNSHREPDLSYVIASMEAILPYLRPGQIVSLESTTYPGTTEEEMRPRIEKTGLVPGRDIFLVYSPEREDPGNPDFRTRTIPKVCGGSTPDCLEAGMALYRQVIDQVVPVSSTRTAEAVKLMENIFRSVNIALVNELKVAFMKMGIDVFEVIRAASTKPFGYMPFYPGPGLGGHCIPIDPFYLTWKAREYDFPTRFIELAGEIGTHMPFYVIEKTIEALNSREKSLKRSRILVLGVAYKKDVDDMRESPALKIIKLLLEKGAAVDYHDPYFPVLPRTRHYSFDMKSIPITDEHIARYDCVLIVTDHSSVDYDRVAVSAQLVVDTRNAVKTKSGNVVKA